MIEKRNFHELQTSFYNQPLMPYLGAKLAFIKDGKANIELDFDKKITQHHGLFHGGVIGTIADNSAGFAAMTLMPKDREPLTIEFKINFLNIANGEKIISEAVILNYGKTIFHGESKVFSIKGDKKKLAATALVTIKATRRVKEIFT